ncbi:type II toxin-antitoxin system VapC family toxin [Flavisphingomonas formosensis]|uniref:type II toxin-antitoxin system VapC family toxin n=1 Tax=Flavisphingomonas formosensis TaxID=861534 RepID=UPI0012F75247|nr:type II toxin-antitoxin system VapC family toxin [Sphingomonas formosensis]
MRAIDTNIVVRFLTADDPAQAAAARTAIAAGDIFISATVFLESEWVLRSGYRFPAARVADGLAGLAGLPGVTVEDPAALSLAIEWMRDGMDFADALHLAKAEGCSAFLSFDKALAKSAKNRSPVPVIVP